jgi:hypothetical protein
LNPLELKAYILIKPIKKWYKVVLCTGKTA